MLNSIYNDAGTLCWLVPIKCLCWRGNQAMIYYNSSPQCHVNKC